MPHGRAPSCCPSFSSTPTPTRTGTTACQLAARQKTGNADTSFFLHSYNTDGKKCIRTRLRYSNGISITHGRGCTRVVVTAVSRGVVRIQIPVSSGVWGVGFRVQDPKGTRLRVLALALDCGVLMPAGGRTSRRNNQKANQKIRKKSTRVFLLASLSSPVRLTPGRPPPPQKPKKVETLFHSPLNPSNFDVSVIFMWNLFEK